MSNVWGTYLRDFRERTGLTQGEFSDAMSLLWLQLNDAEKESLREIGVDHLDLGSSDLSRYENGHRLPRNRSRYTALIFALCKLEGIHSIDEADEWLRKADQGPLTVQEKSAIFDSVILTRNEGSQQESSQQNDAEGEVAVTLPAAALSDRRSVHQSQNVDAQQPPMPAPLRANERSDTSVDVQVQGVDLPVTEVNAHENQPTGKSSSSRVFKFTAWILAITAVVALTVVATNMWGNPAGSLTSATTVPNAAADTPIPTSAPTTAPTEILATDVPSPTSSTDSVSSQVIAWDFSNDLGKWDYFSSDNATQTVQVEDGALCSDITETGQNSWDITLAHFNIHLSANTIYQLTFDVTTNETRNITISLSRVEPKAGVIYSTQPLQAGEQSVAIDILQNFDSENTRLALWLGGQATGQVCFDNISLNIVDTFEPDPPPANSRSDTPGNLIKNADFAEGTGGSNWWVAEANGAAFEVAVRNGAHCATVHHPGTAIWDLMMGQRNINLVGGKEYQLAFDAFSEGIESLLVGTAEHSETLELSPGWSKVEMPFAQVEDEDFRGITFFFGGQPNGKICFDNFLLVESNGE